MRQALSSAGIAPEAVQYINAHGTGTPLGDIAETTAIKRVFGDWAHRLVVSSTKSSVGHSLGASGGLELIAAVRAIDNSVVPPTINLDHPGEGCDLDYCPQSARDWKVDVAMSNSFGFGGHNACILIRRFE
jgi:3-oxoacyl-[acyl-carrier-protein] synthase II